MKVSRRIDQLVDYISKSNFAGVLYDVGCDHGKIGVELLKRNATEKVVFSDISQTNLNKAKMLCKNEKIPNYKVDFILCDGVPVSVKNGDVVLLLGLGGETIIDIIKRAENATEFFLSPTTSVFLLRKFLYSSFEILKDCILIMRDDEINLLHVKKSQKKFNYSKEELFLGKSNIDRSDDKYMNYLKKEFEYLEKLLAKIDANMVQSNVDNEKISNYRDMYNLIKLRLKENESE